MTRRTFKFSTERSWLRVYRALNDTMFTFTSFEHKCITVWGEPAIEEVRKACKRHRISFVEI
jgi:hypothetical protein